MIRHSTGQTQFLTMTVGRDDINSKCVLNETTLILRHRLGRKETCLYKRRIKSLSETEFQKRVRGGRIAVQVLDFFRLITDQTFR